MAGDQVKALLQLASGVGDLTRARAQDIARGLLELPGGESAGRVTGQVAALADELLATATANRENLLALVRAEVETAVGRLGLASASQDQQLREELERLQLENASLRAKLELRDAADASAGRASKTSTRKRSTTRTAKRPTSSPAEPAVTEPAPEKRSTAKQATAKRSTAKRSTSKRATTSRSHRAASSPVTDASTEPGSSS